MKNKYIWFFWSYKTNHFGTVYASNAFEVLLYLESGDCFCPKIIESK